MRGAPGNGRPYRDPISATENEGLSPVFRLKHVQDALTLVDGTLLAALPLMAEASLLNQQEGSGLVKWRLHTQFEVERYVPIQIDVTRNGGGQTKPDETRDSPLFPRRKMGDCPRFSDLHRS